MIEVMIGMGIAAVLLMGFAVLVIQSAKVSRANATELKATLYLREVIEALKDLEQSNWAAIVAAPCAAPFTCHPAAISNAWTLTAGEEALNDGTYTREFSTELVYRDAATGDIVELPGLLDPNTLKVSATIRWHNGITDRQMILETYVYNLP